MASHAAHAFLALVTRCDHQPLELVSKPREARQPPRNVSYPWPMVTMVSFRKERTALRNELLRSGSAGDHVAGTGPRLGAVPQDEWTVWRVDDAALAELGTSS